MNDLKEKLKNLPTCSGVYMHKDSTGAIIYVGKAKSLKNRVKQYFMPNITDGKTLELVKNIADFDYIVTPSELDALILECNLIKKHEPFYNILLKDGKAYPYIKADIKSDFPMLEITRKIKKDGCKYFGPYIGISPNEIIEITNYAYKIKSCKSFFSNKKPLKRECLNYSLGLCSAPCTNKISTKEYGKIFEKVIDFLRGDTQKVKEILIEKMNYAANNEQYETAIKMRDMLANLDKINSKCSTQLVSKENLDIIGYHVEQKYACICVMVVRDGKMLGVDNHLLQMGIENADETLCQFLMQYYDDTSLPKKIIVSKELMCKDLLMEYFDKHCGKTVKIIVPQKGINKKLLDLALKNSKLYFEKEIDKYEVEQQRTIGAVNDLKNSLGLKNLPKRIEGYDISNISGVDKVASMVVFVDGQKKSSDYRKFKIKTVEGANDFASLNEALSRRMKKFDCTDSSFSSIPDLILIDGGKGQLSAVYDVINQVNPNIDVISLAKNEEIVFKPKDDREYILSKRNLGLQLLQRVRDEAHRFAITYFKNIHTKKLTYSELENIAGIGKVKRKALITHFKSIENIKNSDIAGLINVKGINTKDAQKIVQYFKEQKNGI